MADDEATRMSRAIAEARDALQTTNRSRTTNTVVGAVSGALTGNPLIAATQASVANQQPTPLDRIAASATDVNPNRGMMPPIMEDLQNNRARNTPPMIDTSLATRIAEATAPDVKLSGSFTRGESVKPSAPGKPGDGTRIR